MTVRNHKTSILVYLVIAVIAIVNFSTIQGMMHTSAFMVQKSKSQPNLSRPSWSSSSAETSKQRVLHQSQNGNIKLASASETTQEPIPVEQGRMKRWLSKIKQSSQRHRQN